MPVVHDLRTRCSPVAARCCCCNGTVFLPNGFGSTTFRFEYSLIARPKTPARHLQELEQSVGAGCKHSVLWSAQLHLHAESPHGWDPQLEAHPKGDNDPSGPNDTRRIITNQKQQIKYPCYCIRDTQSLKDKQMHDNV